MKGINNLLEPEFVDISNYPKTHIVYMKQFERIERILVEIRDLMAEQAKPKKQVKRKPPTKQ